MNEELKEKFVKAIESYKQINLLLHNFPDPDCIGASLGLTKVIRTIWPNIVVKIYGHGVSDPQNRIIIKVLNITVIDSVETPPIADETTGNIFIDFNPSSTNHDHTVTPIWCVDHHIDIVTADHSMCDIRPVGSACTVVFDYIQSFGIELSKELPEDVNLAIGMLLGIKIDTNDLLSDETTALDDEAYRVIRTYCSPEKLNKILRAKLPKYYYEKLRISLEKNKIIDSIVVINLGFMDEDQRDVIPRIADVWATRDGTEVVVVFGILNELSSISVSVRVEDKASITAKELVRKVFKVGGGHDDKAGAQIKLDLFNPKYIPEGDRQKFLDVLTSVVLTRTCQLTDTK